MKNLNDYFFKKISCVHNCEKSHDNRDSVGAFKESEFAYPEKQSLFISSDFFLPSRFQFKEPIRMLPVPMILLQVSVSQKRLWWNKMKISIYFE